jgi:polyphosphate kinase 2 (PPK2 family)
MGFCTTEQTNHFLRECRELEPVFRRAGIRLTKFFFGITKEEQAKRFHSRQTSPLKVGKMSAVDLVSQSKWDEYVKANNRMINETHDWVVIDSNDKAKARIAAMQYVLLNNDYLGKDLEAIGSIDPNILRTTDEKETHHS